MNYQIMMLLGQDGVTNGAGISGTSGYIAQYPDSLDFFKDIATYWIDNYEIASATLRANVSGAADRGTTGSRGDDGAGVVGV